MTFQPFVIVAYGSLSCLPCEKMDLKIIQSLLERVSNMQKMLEKPKNLWDLEDFSEEQRAVILSGQNKSKTKTDEQI